MSGEKKKFLPKIAIGATKDEIDLENGYVLEFKLKLFDSNGHTVTNYKATDDDIRAVLSVYIINITNTEFPDPDDWLTYRFVKADWLEKDSNGFLKFPQDKKKELFNRINRMNGNFVKTYGKQHFSIDKGGKASPREGLENTDMKYKIETNDTPSIPGSPGIRIDIYSIDGTVSRKPITEDKVEVNLILNKKVQLNLEEDGLIAYPVFASKPKWKWWQTGLISLAVLVGLAIILGIIFHRRIKEWWKKKSKKKESQLEVF